MTVTTVTRHNSITGNPVRCEGPGRKRTSPCFFLLVVSCLLQSGIEIRRAPSIFTGLQAVRAILLVKLPGFFRKNRIRIAAVRNEMPEPVILLAVGINGITNALRKRRLEVLINCLLRAFDDPCHDGRTGFLYQVLRIILNVCFSGNLRVERDHHKPSSDTVVICPDTRQMVGIQHQRMGRHKIKQRFVLLLRKDLVRRAKLLHHCGIEPHAFFHFGNDDEAFAFKLRHFGLHISLAVHGQSFGGQLARIISKHPEQRIPEGLLPVCTVTVRDDEMLLVDFADRCHTHDLLHVIDQFLIPAEKCIECLQPDVPALTSG